MMFIYRRCFFYSSFGWWLLLLLFSLPLSLSLFLSPWSHIRLRASCNQFCNSVVFLCKQWTMTTIKTNLGSNKRYPYLRWNIKCQASHTHTHTWPHLLWTACVKHGKNYPTIINKTNLFLPLFCSLPRLENERSEIWQRFVVLSELSTFSHWNIAGFALTRSWCTFLKYCFLLARPLSNKCALLAQLHSNIVNLQIMEWNGWILIVVRCAMEASESEKTNRNNDELMCVIVSDEFRQNRWWVGKT